MNNPVTNPQSHAKANTAMPRRDHRDAFQIASININGSASPLLGRRRSPVGVTTMKLINLSLLTMALFLSGCGGGGPSHQSIEKYYLVCANSKIPYWQEAGAGLTQAAKELLSRYLRRRRSDEPLV